MHTPQTINGRLVFHDRHDKLNILLAGINRKSEALSVINDKLRHMEETNQTHKRKYQIYLAKRDETQGIIGKLMKLSKDVDKKK